MGRPILYVGRELPGLDIFWLDDIGGPVDLSVGTWTYTVTLEVAGTTSTLTTTVAAQSSPTGDTGSAADVPTVRLSWAAGALDSITTGAGVMRIAATTASRHRLCVIPVEIRV